MAALNDRAARAALKRHVRTATDVTGFGLVGHALNVARESGVSLEIRAREVPLLPGAEDRALRFQAGGMKSNRRAFEDRVFWRSRPDPAREALLFDPQTSGGLLLFVEEETVAALLTDLPEARLVGKVVPPGAKPIIVT
jgi:selenide,water dikinase